MANDVKHDAIALFNEIFERDMSEEAFEYKHFANPDILETPYSVEYDGGRLVSMLWYLGAHMRCLGESRLAAQGGDAASAKDGRGLPFIKVCINGDKKLKEQAVAFRFATPTRNALPVMTRLGEAFLGTFEFGRLKAAELDRKPKGLFARTPRQLLEKAARKAASEYDLSFAVAVTCPFSEADFARINSCNDKVFPARSEAYYVWKIDNFEKAFPSKQFMYLTLRRRGTGELAAFCIVQEIDGRYRELVDWNLCGAGGAYAHGLLSFLVLEGVKEASELGVPFVNAANEEHALFAECGFEFEPSDSFTVRTYEEGLDAILDMRPWQLRKIDMDYFLNVY